MPRMLSLISVCVLIAVVARAQERCDFGSEEPGAGLEKYLLQAKSCKEAVARIHECAWGSSADTQFAPIVVAKCEKRFFGALSPAGQKRYGDEMRLCAYEYARQEGTLFMSAAALCQVDVAAHFATNLAEAERPVPRASFACAKAQTTLEKTICSDISLGHADLVLSRVYSRVLENSHGKDRTTLVQNERKWLQNIPKRCGLRTGASQKSSECVRNEFELRFTALDACGGTEVDDCLSDLASQRAATAAPVAAARASFDCETPATALEIVICADSELGQADIALAQSYHDADAVLPSEQHKELVESERQWLRFVESSCPLGAVGGIPSIFARGCVRAAFQKRIDQLQTCPKKQPNERMPCLNDFLLFDRDWQL